MSLQLLVVGLGWDYSHRSKVEFVFLIKGSLKWPHTFDVSYFAGEAVPVFRRESHLEERIMYKEERPPGSHYSGRVSLVTVHPSHTDYTYVKEPIERFIHQLNDTSSIVDVIRECHNSPNLRKNHVQKDLVPPRRGSRIQKGGFRTFRRAGFVQEFQERIQIVAEPWANQQAQIADSHTGAISDHPKKKPVSAHAT